MKKLFYSLIIALVSLYSFGCSSQDTELQQKANNNLGNTDDTNSGKIEQNIELQRVDETLDAIIEQYGQYPYEEVGLLLGGMWRVEASLEYNADYTKPLKIDHAMGRPSLPDREESLLTFYSKGNMYLCEYNTDYTLKQRRDGSWYFEGRTEQLTFTLSEESHVVRLCAVGDEYLVLDWTNKDQTMRTLFKPCTMKTIEIEKATHQINAAISGGENYDQEQAAELLVGKWILQTLVEYDDAWEKVTSPAFVDHVANAVGFTPDDFTISADGTYLHHYELEFPLDGDDDCHIENRGEWQFDPMTEELIFTGEYVNAFKIRALTERYFVADYYDKINKDNHRAIYERR